MQREDIMYTGVLHIFSEGVSQMSGAYSVVLEVVSVLEVHKPASTLMARVFTAGALYSFFFIGFPFRSRVAVGAVSFSSFHVIPQFLPERG